jgi:malonyl CoA-acyl carrier protein transacylase/4'-phosphopantetheinyl transferase EntD
MTFSRRWDTEAFILGEDARHSLVERAEHLAEWCAGNRASTIRDVAFSLNSELGTHRYCLAIVAGSIEELERKLRYAANRLVDPNCRRINEKGGIYYTDEPLARQGRVAFLFPGEGAQYPHMLSDLCVHFPEIRACFDLLERALHERDASLLPSQFIFPRGELHVGTNRDRLWQMDGAVEAVFTANRALLALLDRLQIIPHMILGHSTGEYNALLASGALRIEDEEELIRYLREGNHLSERLLAEGHIAEGVLLAVGPADQELITSVLESMQDSIWLAIDNCPHQVVLFGSELAIAEVLNRLRQTGAVCQKLPFNRAYHTPLFMPVRAELEKFFCTFHIVPPRIDIYSCATAEMYPTEPERIRELVLEQWTSPVRFRQAIENMYDAGARVFIEVGPRGNLTAFVDDILRGRAHVAVPVNVQRRSGVAQINHFVARLAANGVAMCLDHLYAGRTPQRVSFNGEITSKSSPSPSTKLALALPVISLPSVTRAQAPKVNRSVPPTVPTNGQSPVVSLAATDINGLLHAPLASGPPGARAAVMREYFQTMERFLETQRAVMGAFISQHSTRTELPQEASDHVSQAAPVHTQYVSGCDVSPVDHLAEVSSALPLTSHAPSQGLQTESVQDTLLRIVMEKTGYPRDMLDLSASLEADLGIDSIKRVEMVGALQREIGHFSNEEMESASRLKTLQEIVDFVTHRRESMSGNGQPELGRILPSDALVSPHQEESVIAETGGHYQGPFAGTLVSLTRGREVRTVRVFDLSQDVFLRDHALGASISASDIELCALVVLPLTISVECLAQVASLLVPGKSLLTMRDIRAHRWIAFEESQVTVEILARVSPGSPLEIKASLTARSGEFSGVPAVEATLVFSDSPAEPKTAGPFKLRSERPSRWTSEQLYTEAMFHGPVFRGVTSVDRLGEDGIQATLRVSSGQNLLPASTDPVFLTRPLLLDAAGQLVGFWTADCLSKGYVVFPFHVESIDLYGPSPTPGEVFTGRARVALVGDTQVRANIEVLDAENTVRISLSGWEDKRIDMPDDFFRFRLSPREVMLSSPWPLALASAPADHGLACYRFESNETFFRAEGGIWRSVLAHLILSREERRAWSAMKASDRRRTQWLLGRVVAKDAVRAFVRERSGIALYPADIEIVTDEHGQPHVSGEGLQQTGVTPLLSIAHIDDFGVAIVGDAARYRGIGVDVERRHQMRPGFDHLILTDDERRVVAQRGIVMNDEWNLRLWCAKEAVGKALGRGLVGGPASLLVLDVEVTAGMVQLEVNSSLASELSDVMGLRFTASTTSEDELIISIVWRI